MNCAIDKSSDGHQLGGGRLNEANSTAVDMISLSQFAVGRARLSVKKNKGVGEWVGYACMCGWPSSLDH